MPQTAIRQRIIKLRNSFNSTFQQSCSKDICQQIINSAEYQSAKHIAVYIAIGKEIDLHTLIEDAWNKNKNIYLPRLNKQQLDFALYIKEHPLKNNHFNIPEPELEIPNFTIDQLDIIYMPLVAHDDQLNRIGMGGGYYDRSLSRYKELTKPLRIGVAYKEQRVEDCYTNEWDIPMHKVISSS